MSSAAPRATTGSRALARDWSGFVLRCARAGRADGTVHRRVFLLGGDQEQYVTIASQQTRAINLAWALARTRRLAADPADGSPSIAVVGAGAGGATFAVAAAQLGARVAVFDEHEEPISAQRWSRDRHLHPNIISWPNRGWDLPDTELPVMNWSAGPTADVRLGLAVEFAAATTEQGPIAWHPQHVVWEIDEDGDGVALAVGGLGAFAGVSASDHVHAARERFDVVVVASGFLPERRGPSVHAASASRGYWRDGMLSPTATDDERAVENGTTIVGLGDGALTDLMTLTLAGGRSAQFVHAELVEYARELADDDHLVHAVLEIERDAAEDPSVDTIARFRELWRRGNYPNRTLRQGPPVALVGRQTRSNRHASTLNRLLAALVIEHGRAGLTRRPDAVRPEEVPDDGTTLVWRSGPRARTIRIAYPVFSPRDVQASADEQPLPGLPTGLVTDLLDITRTPFWDAGFLPSLTGPPRCLEPPVERRSVRGQHPIGVLWTRIDRPVADHLPTDCRHLASVARAVHDRAAATTAPDNFRVEERGVLLSLDVVACVSDLTPVEVVCAVLQRPVSGVELETTTVARGSRTVARTWVRVSGESDDATAITKDRTHRSRAWELTFALLAPALHPVAALLDPDAPSGWRPRSATGLDVANAPEDATSEVLRQTAARWNATAADGPTNGDQGSTDPAAALEQAERGDADLLRLHLENEHRALREPSSWRSLVRLAAMAAHGVASANLVAQFARGNGLLSGDLDGPQIVRSFLAAAERAAPEAESALVLPFARACGLTSVDGASDAVEPVDLGAFPST